MNDKVLYYYIRSTVDNQAAYFNHGKGIVGYTYEKPDKKLYFKGTIDELDTFINNQRPRSAHSHAKASSNLYEW